MYGSHTDASAYFAAHGLSGYPDDQVAGDGLLSRASAVLDDSYRWKGQVSDLSQSRKWPRAGVRDDEGQTIAADEVPARIVMATYELARLLAVQSVDLESSERDIKRIKAGSVDVEYQARDRASVTPLSLAQHSNVLSLVRPLMVGLAGEHPLRLRRV